MKVKYKGSYIVDSTDTTKKLLTKGKYCEDDIEITAEGGDEGFCGVSAKDFFYSFPSPNSKKDEDGAYVDLSAYSITSAINFLMGGFQFSRVKSFVGPIEKIDSEYQMRNIFYNNKCIQYFMLNFGEYLTTGTARLSGSYSHYTPVTGATNLRVFVFNSTHPITLSNSYHAYLSGASASSSAPIIKTMVYNKVEQINGSSCFSYAGGNNANLVTLWFPDLEGVNALAASYSGMQNVLTSCKNCKQVFFPKLKQIGYTTTGSSYAQLKNFYIKQTGQAFNFAYFPALETIHCVSTTASNGTFATSTGVYRWFFPRLSLIDGTGAKNILNGCSSTTEIHFGKKNKAYIEAHEGYATKWGASSSATIFFDLINDITVGGTKYTRRQDKDYMTSLTYNGKVYYRDDSLRDANNVKWCFWAWKASDGSVVYTQNTLCLDGDWVWQYIPGERFEYKELGQISANDWRYGWTDSGDNTIYTTNQWTPAIGDQTYRVSSDGKSFVNNATIGAVE